MTTTATRPSRLKRRASLVLLSEPRLGAKKRFACHPGRKAHGDHGAVGTGKTTLLRVLAGILKPNRGRITVFDQPVHERSQARAKLR